MPRRSIARALPLALLAAACTGDDPAPTVAWSPCGTDRFECASLIVPADPARKDGAQLELPLIRWPALTPADRLGVLVFLPGGPGQSGVAAVRALPAVGRGIGEVLRRFDVVGLDQRGTGASSPAVACGDQAAHASLLSDLEAAPDDDAAGALMAALFGGCRDALGADLLGRFGTADAVADLERLRRALGEEELSLFGVSYGTWTAAAYASEHGDRVRSAVLASPMPASNDAFDRAAAVVRGTESALDGFFAWCDAAETCQLRAGADGGARAAFEAVAAGLDPIPPRDLATFRHVVRRSLYRPDYPALDTLLAATRDGDPLPLLRASAALQAETDYAAALVVIRATDDQLAAGADAAVWRARLADLRAEAPTYGALVSDRDLFVRAALHWPEPRRPFALTARPDAPPFLLLSNPLDPVTPGAAAVTLGERFANGSVQVLTRTPGHDTLSDRCAMEHAVTYLLAPDTLRGAAPQLVCPPSPDGQEVVASASARFPWSPDASRAAESALGDLVADALRAASGADIAFVNGGGLRAALPASEVLPAATTLRRPEPGYAAGPPYDVIVADVAAVLPFGNRLVRVDVSGADLWAFLEHAVSEYRGPSQGSRPFVQVSGLRFAFDQDAPAGARVASVTLADGAPIARDDARAFVVALPDHVWIGGTGFTAWAEGAPAPAADVTLDEALVDYLRARPAALMPATDGRITAL